MVDNRPTSQIAAMFEPLDGYLKKEPIEAFDDIAPGLVQGMTVDGKLIGIPVRHATQGLFYNEALLEEQGISAPPTTLEELVEQAQKLTFTSKSGARVSGMVLASDLAVFPVMFARAFGGDFLTKTFELIPDQAAMEKGLTVLRNMFDAGSLPRSYATTKNDDQVTWIQQGRAAFTVLPFARHAQLNNPEQSKFPGKIKAVEFPVSAALKGKTPMAYGRRVLGHGHSREFPRQGPVMEVHPRSLEQAGDARHGDQRQRARAGVDLQGRVVRRKEPGRRRRGCCASERTWGIPPVPRGGAGSIHLPRGGATCGAWPQAGQRGHRQHLVPRQAAPSHLTDRQEAPGDHFARRSMGDLHNCHYGP